MLAILLPVFMDAVLVSSAVVLYFFCVEPALRYRRARWPAFALAAAAATGVPVLLVLFRINAIAAEVMAPGLLAGLALLVLGWSWPGLMVQLTGGSRPFPPDVGMAISAGMELWRRYDAGDLEGAEDVAADMESMRTPSTERYVNAWRDFIADERAGRGKSERTRSAAIAEITAEGTRLRSLPGGAKPRSAWGVALLAAIVAATPTYMAAAPCIGVETSLPRAATVPPREPLPLADALVPVPEAGATLVYDDALDLEVAAESRHDPQARDQLVTAGFIAARSRDFRAIDGRRIHVDVFEFEESVGALQFQATVNRYACRFSTEQFDGAHGAIGLRVRWSVGDPFEEQLSWVVGSRRYLVEVRALTPPADHSRIFAIAREAMAWIGMPAQ